MHLGGFVMGQIIAFPPPLPPYPELTKAGQVAVVLTGVAPIRSVSASVSILSMASPHGASVIPRPMVAIPYRFAGHGQGKLHQD
jgi:hypothetical protein